MPHATGTFDDDSPCGITGQVGVRTLEIRLVYHASCPHRRRTRKRLRHAIQYAGIEQPIVEEVCVTTFDEAVAAQMGGSPTILIDGHDPFARPGDGPSLGCRLFETESGLDGAPSVLQLIDVIRAAATRRSDASGKSRFVDA